MKNFHDYTYTASIHPQHTYVSTKFGQLVHQLACFHLVLEILKLYLESHAKNYTKVANFKAQVVQSWM